MGTVTYLKTLFIGKKLHTCYDKSKLEHVRLDLYEKNADVIFDTAQMDFPDESFNTVLCDPSYNGKYQWNHNLLKELCRVAKDRIIFQHWFIPATPQGCYRKAQDKFYLSQVYVWRREHILDMLR